MPRKITFYERKSQLSNLATDADGISEIVSLATAKALSPLESYQSYWTKLGFDYPQWLSPLPDILFGFRKGVLDKDPNWQNRSICVSAPPGHSKSYTLLLGMLWLAANIPKYRILYVTYSQPIAIAQQRICRSWLETLGIQTKMMNANDWMLSNGSTIYFTGIDASITGRRADLIVCDDLYSGAEVAFSAKARQDVITNLQSVVFTRLAPGSGANILVSMARWFPDDAIGYLTSKEQGFKLIELPAYTTNPTTGRRKALAPNLFSLDDLDRLRRRVGKRLFQAQYLQQPSYQDGALFESKHLNLLSKQPEPEGLSIAIGLDLAYSKSNAARFDNCAYVVLGMDADVNCYILDAKSKRCNYLDFADDVRAAAARYGARIVSYASGIEKQILETMNQQFALRIEILPAWQNKAKRAELCIDAFNHGRFSLYLPNGNETLDATGTQFQTLLSELFIFEGGNQTGHDDSVDAMVSAYNYLTSKKTSRYSNVSWVSPPALNQFLY